LRAKIDTGAIVAPTARPKRIARSTAPRLATGSVPGRARSTGHACVFGAAPNAVDAPLKIFERGVGLDADHDLEAAHQRARPPRRAVHRPGSASGGIRMCQSVARWKA
jgi:hypothetical protein